MAEQSTQRTRGAGSEADWELHRTEGAGRFHSRLTWRLPDGGELRWESRPGRKRGIAATRADVDGNMTVLRTAPETLRRLRRANRVVAAAFALGGSLFALGAVVAQLGSGDALTAASIYCAGGLFFTAGAYASLLGAVNAPRSTRHDDRRPQWRWWSYEPERVDWASTFVLLAGTAVFGISLADSLLRGLTAEETNRLIWAPEVAGCILFLVSGNLALAEVCHRWRPCLRRRDLGWSIVAVNQAGSVLFMVSGLAAFTLPATGSEINVHLANWATLTGAVCFAVAGVLQAGEGSPGPSG